MFCEYRVFLLVGVLALLVHPSWAQLPEHKEIPPDTQHQPGQADTDNQPDQAQQQAERDRQKKLNTQRHAALKRDTDKLLQLATELKQAVDKSNENTLSLDVIKKASEIERLAKNVKEKMKGE
jgi:hypothetical protein